MDFPTIVKDLKAKKFSPIYFLMGDEPYFIDKISDYIEDHVLSEGEKSFNQTILYGKDTEIRTIVDEARQFPMMASHRVVIIKEAKELKKFTELEAYFAKPSPQAIVVFCYKYGSIDKRTKAYKALDANGVIFESKKMYDDKLPGWIESYCREKGISIDQASSHMIAEYLGSDLTKIGNEIDKLSISVPNLKSITVDVVKSQIGNSKDYDVFDFQKAIGIRDWVLATRIISYMDNNMKAAELPPVITSLFNFFNKVLITHTCGAKTMNDLGPAIGLPPFIAKDYFNYAKNFPLVHAYNVIQAIKLADLQSKGVGRHGQTVGSILKELLISCMYNQPGLPVNR